MNMQNTNSAVYAYLDRINNLIRSQEQLICKEFDLQPVQLRMLTYLDLCNQYSNTPAGVTEYMKLTKGTVSQSLKALEAKGYIEKRPDSQDKRQVHLEVTEAGQEILEHLPPSLIGEVNQMLGKEAAQETATVLHRLLVIMQRENGMSGFGVCRTCHYHQVHDEHHFRCGLTEELLAAPQAELICREHEWPAMSYEC